jgi:dienelactone hydrolase
MVRVVGGRHPVRFGLVGEVDDYWIDRLEVSNRQFKEFVDRGGYRLREYWQEPFVEGERSVSWEEAVGRFRDATGQPGPATWKSGTYSDGQGDLPVGGVSWYEAAAYAAFAGKSLPTIHHWYRAAGLGRFADILTVSNFGEKGPAPVGSHGGLGPFGTYDMAGNVKEWCWTETNAGRFLLGGAWNEPRYMFGDYDARGPFERAPGYGFRLAKYIRPLPPAVAAPVRIEALARDARKKPVGDDIFAVYRRQYAYDPAPLNSVVEATEETSAWVRYTVGFDAAYGGERVRVFLFLPKNGSPPYQTVIFFPGADAFFLRSSRDLSMERGEFIIRSGRAFLYPVYKGTYERSTFGEEGSNAERDLRIAWSRDLGRAIDYLETRSDIDPARLAFYGMSTGADAGVLLTALEPRLKVSILQGTGIYGAAAPEIDALNYAPRVRVPTLLLNGRYDFEIPVDTAQRPLFALLGSPAEHKRHRIFETGHALPIEDVAGEILHWLDRYLGPVVPSAGIPSANSGR